MENPRDTRALGLLGSAYVQEQRFDEAKAVFLRMLRLSASNSAANYNLGLLALLENRPAQALPRFKAVLQRTPKDVPALTGALESQLMLKRLSAARSTARALTNLLSPSDPAYYQIAGLLATHQEYSTAIPMLEKVHALKPSNFESSFNLALAYLEGARLDDAALVIAPFTTNAEAADLLGTIEQRRGNVSEASQAYRRAIELAPRNEDYRVNFGSELLCEGKLGDAVKVFRAGLQKNPESWRMRLGLGSSLYIAGQYEDAAAALLEAAQRHPDAPIVYVLLAKAYEAAPALQPQIAVMLESYVRLEPTDASVYLAYGDLLYYRQQFNAARHAYERALSLDPGSGEAHLKFGVVLQFQGETKQALAEFERAVKANPKLGAAHYRLGLAYQKLGRTREAQAEMSAFRELGVQTGDARDQIMRSLTAR